MESQLLEDAVYTEKDILNLLAITQDTLDVLRREKGFPFVRLTRVNRVYLAKDVLKWIEEQSRNQKELL